MKYLIVIFVLVFSMSSCRQILDKNRPVSTSPLDTIQDTQTRSTARPEIYESAFLKGYSSKYGETAIRFFSFTAGTVQTNSGSVVICDPMHVEEYGIPFTTTFPRGNFPVQLSVLQAAGEEAIAFARIKFSDEPVVQWKQAFRENQKEVAFGGEDDPETYCVDGGTAIFLDFQATKDLILPIASDFDGPIFNAMYKNHRVGWRFAMYEFGEHNLAAFTTGLGDGCYKSYIGYDTGGKPCRLITDFGLVRD
jgi:hypothetical protein